jgi:hypothetical protein
MTLGEGGVVENISLRLGFNAAHFSPADSVTQPLGSAELKVPLRRAILGKIKNKSCCVDENQGRRINPSTRRSRSIREHGQVRSLIVDAEKVGEQEKAVYDSAEE